MAASPRREEQDKWTRGHTSIQDAVDGVELTLYQRIELALLVNLIGLLRPIYRLVRRLLGRPYDVTAGLDDVCDTPCDTLGTRFQETHGEHYLTRAQVETFERDGVLSPMPLLTEEEAAELRAFYLATHDADWHDKHVIGQQVVDELKANDLWGIKQGSLWQELNFDQLLDVVRRPMLAQRLASLLGDDVVAWRSQAFSIEAGAKGTFWHLATTFVEDGELPTLTPPPGRAPALTTVNCWLALEDVDETNSCMHIVPGTHRDVRLDTMLRRFMKDRIGFVMAYNRRDRRRALVAIRYSGDLFLGAQLGFARAMELAPDLYNSMDPVAYPMKAGEVLIFSSNAMHCSKQNTTDSARLAMGIRTTSADVGIFVDQPTIPFSTGSGLVDIPTRRMQAGTPIHTSGGAVDVIDLREPGKLRHTQLSRP